MNKTLITWVILGVLAVVIFKNFGKIKSAIASKA